MGYAIAIDGPSGSGKSTVAKKIATIKSFVYIDTGAMYRAVALYCVRNKIPTDNAEKVEAMLDNIDIGIAYRDGLQVVFLNGEDVNGLIRTEEISSNASTVSAIPSVRRKLVSLQRKLAEKTDVVMDGRDIGTVVLPNADVKVFLTANSDIRAKRRYDELVMKGYEGSLQDVADALRVRDKADSGRKASPLKMADGAVYIDSSGMTVDEVAEKIIGLIRKA